jgi:hypothetical protein
MGVENEQSVFWEFVKRSERKLSSPEFDTKFLGFSIGRIGS